MSLPDLAHSESDRAGSDEKIKLSLYDVSHQKFVVSHQEDSGEGKVAFVDAKTQVGPLIIVDPIVLGTIEDHPGKTVIEKIGNDQFKIRVSGSVFDILADGIGNGRADVQSVTMSLKSSLNREMQTTPVQSILLNEQNTHAPNPYQADFDQNPSYFNAIRPFPFAGRFEFEEQLVYDLQDIDIMLFAASVVGETGVAQVEINITNETHEDFDVHAEIIEPHSGQMMYAPFILHITDPSVSSENIENQTAYVNGVEVGLRTIDGQLQLDRPLFASYKRPAQSIPNLMQITPQTTSMFIEYKGQQLRIAWGYTTSSN